MKTDQPKKPSLGQLVKTMLGIGCVGFGGGSALIPVLEETLVRKRHFISEDEFNKDIVIASVTPGALPVEISAGVGKQAAGPFGMLASAASISLPGVALTVFAMAVLSQFGNEVIQQVGFLSIGALAYILCVLLHYSYTVIFKAKTHRLSVLNALIALVVFAMIGESSFVKLTGLTDTLPTVHLSIINVMAVAFFLVFWTHGDYSAKRVVPGAIIAGLYLLGADGSFGLEETPLELVAGLTMLAMALAGLRQEMQGKQHLFDITRLKDLGKEVAAAACMLVVFCIPALLVYEGTPEFVGRGILSALTSFGGGDAYLALADGLFVTTGLVLYVDFYNQLVPVANALPGSILCKVLSGMGFFIGYRATGDVMVGLAVALAGFSCSISMSSTTFSVVDFFYSGLEHFRSFKMLKKAISPIIVGLMGSVALNLMRSCTTISVGSLPVWFAPVLCLVLTAGNLLVMHKAGNRPLPMVIGMAAISCAACNILALC
ncbi:MAG: chromate transporter [Eggerthellaceae bacterium]|jgi:chromate transporter